MKRIYFFQMLAAISLAFYSSNMWAQTCPPSGITFTSQQQIDSFAANYPGCTEIPGAVTIDGASFSSITNLNGLSQITVIQGGLRIIENFDLISLTGLDNLTSVGWNLEIIFNADLIDLAPLSNLTFVGGVLRIRRNLDLISLTGLENLTSLEGGLDISSNYDLPDLTGLSNLTSIGGGITIYDSDALVDFTGLDNLTSISGNIVITENDVLSSLSGFDNIDYSGITDLSIKNNPNLTFCSVSSICDYLTDGGTLELYSNAFACNTLADISYSCVSSLPCPEPGILLRNQEQIDDFPLNYPTCTSVANITIVSADGETPVTNLNGLSQITSITGDLYIHNNDSLQTLAGLNNLTFIGGYLQIGAYTALSGCFFCGGGNNSLYSLEGLNNLVFIGGKLEVHGNNALTDLTALNNLTSIGDYFKVTQNDALTNFTGLENLTSIGLDTWIDENDALISFTGLDGLTIIGGRLLIGWNSGNNALISIEGLNSLTACGDLIIQGNDALGNLAGLENLTSVNGYLSIHDNNTLLDVSGLQNLTSITGELRIYRNAELSSIAGLSNIDYSGITYPFSADAIRIFQNPNLSECSISSICDYLYSGGGLTPSGNNTGCNSKMEILAGCLMSDPCAVSTDGDTLAFMYDDDIYVNATGFANNPSLTFTDTTIASDAFLLDISLELYFRLNGNSCENEIAIQLTDPTGNTQLLTTYTTCDGGSELYFIELPLPNTFINGNGNNWLIEFDDTNNQNIDHEYVVKFIRLNYTSTTTLSAPNSILHVNDQPVSNGIYQASNQLNSTGTIPNGGAVNFKAGQTILLDNEFNVGANADFSATIEDCN